MIEVAENAFPRGHYTSLDEIAAQFEMAGFELSERHDFLERQSFQIFVPRSEVEEKR